MRTEIHAFLGFIQSNICLFPSCLPPSCNPCRLAPSLSPTIYDMLTCHSFPFPYHHNRLCTAPSSSESLISCATRA